LLRCREWPLQQLGSREVFFWHTKDEPPRKVRAASTTDIANPESFNRRIHSSRDRLLQDCLALGMDEFDNP
jgi:hypothetical protein